MLSEKTSLSTIFGIRISMMHVIGYNIGLLLLYEILIGFWADRNSWYNLTAALWPLQIYACIAVPSYLLVGFFLRFYRKFSFSTSKIIWYLLVGISIPAAVLCGIGSLFTVPGIITDGSEGWAIVISSLVYPPFVVFSTLGLLLLEKTKIDLFRKTYFFNDEGRKVYPKYD